MTKLIFLEGVSGAGKSTLARSLEERLLALGFSAHAWVEFDHTNPIDFYCTAALTGEQYGDLLSRYPDESEAFIKNSIPAGEFTLVRYYHGDDRVFSEPLSEELYPFELCYHPQRPLPLEVYTEIYRAVWQSFAESLYKKYDYLIFDGSLIHHPVNDMIRNYGADKEYALSHVVTLLAALGDTPRAVFYVKTDDLAFQLALAHSDRGQPPPSEYELTFWKTRQDYDRYILAGLSEKIEYFSPSDGWEKMHDRALSSALAI